MSAGEPAMTPAEVVEEVAWLTRNSASAAEMKASLGRTAESLAMLCRNAGRADLASPFYAEITLEQAFESNRPKVNPNQKWSDEEFAAALTKARELIGGGMSVNAAAKRVPFSRSYLRNLLYGLNPRAAAVAA